jgi:hypothetical protein
MLAQSRKQVVDLSSEGIFQIVDTTGLRARPINAPILVVISSPNQALFQVSVPATDSGRGPIIGRGRLEYSAETGDVFVTSLDSLTNVHVEAAQNGRVIASGDGAYVVVHREPNGVAIESRSQLPPSVTPVTRKPQ